MPAIPRATGATGRESDWVAGLWISLALAPVVVFLRHEFGNVIPISAIAILVAIAITARYHWAPPLFVFLTPVFLDALGAWWPALSWVLPGKTTIQSGLLFAAAHSLAIVLTHRYVRRTRSYVELLARFEIVFQQSEEGFVFFDPEWTVVACNPRVCELLGRRREEVIGSPSNLLLEGWEPRANRGPVEIKTVSREGGAVWLEGRLQSLPGGEGLGILRDVTPQRQAENESEKQIQWQQAVIDALPMEIAVLDRRGLIRMVNRAWRELGRKSKLPLPHDGVGSSYLEVCERVLEPDRTEAQCIGEGLRAVLARKRANFSRVYGCSLEGERSWIEIRVEALPDGAAIAHLDITAQVKIQEQLRTANSRLRAVIDCSPVSIVTFSPEGLVISWNRGAERTFGWTEEEAVGQSLKKLLPGGGLDCFERLLEQAEKPNSEPMEVRREHKDGRMLDIRTWSRRIQSEPDQPVQYLTVAEDVTDARRVEEHLRHALKMEAMGRLAGGVAHDFSNLLTVMLGFGGLLEQKLPAEAPGGREAREIVLAAERAAALTAQLLAFSRRQIHKPRPVFVNQLIGNLERMLHRLIGEDVQLTIDLHPQLPPVLADPQDIELAIVNLAVNSRDAMPNGGTLEIATRAADPLREGLDPGTAWIEIMVKDSGEGIRDEVRPFLFEPFFTTKEFGRGTGLGLANVRDVLTRAGGEIRVTSNLGRGSTFRLLLPVAREVKNVVGPEPTATAGPAARQEMVWLVEDDQAVRELVEGMLRKAGYRTRAVADPDAPVRWALSENVPPDLLLTDVVLPGSNGTELAKRLRAMWPALRVLYVSGYPHEVLARHGVFGDDVHFLAKPFTAELLLGRVREILNRAAIPVD